MRSPRNQATNPLSVPQDGLVGRHEVCFAKAPHAVVCPSPSEEVILMERMRLMESKALKPHQCMQLFG